MFDKSDVIFAYTRADAIADGVLVDLTDYKAEGMEETLATSRGIKLPVAVTSTVYGQYIALPEDYKGEQTFAGRLSDVFSNFVLTVLLVPENREKSEIFFPLVLPTISEDGKDSGEEIKTMLKAHIGPGDTTAPVLTIMLPDED
jgi:hypothetical protein